MGYGNARGFKARKRNGLGGLIGPPSVKAGKLVARPGTCVPEQCNLHIVAYRGASGNSIRMLVRARCVRIGPRRRVSSTRSVVAAAYNSIKERQLDSCGAVSSIRGRRHLMAHRQRTMVRKPATKFPKLRKKMQQQVLRPKVQFKPTSDKKR